MLPTAFLEGGYVQSLLEPIGHVHGKLFRNKAALFFSGSWVTPKNLRRPSWECCTLPIFSWESQAWEHCALKKTSTHEKAGYGGTGISSPTLMWHQFSLFFCQILRSYMTSGQCYEDNATSLFALPSLLSCYAADLEWLVMLLRTKNNSSNYIYPFFICTSPL